MSAIPPITADETDPHLDWTAQKTVPMPYPYRTDYANAVPRNKMPDVNALKAFGVDLSDPAMFNHHFRFVRIVD